MEKLIGIEEIKKQAKKTRRSIDEVVAEYFGLKMGVLDDEMLNELSNYHYGATGDQVSKATGIMSDRYFKRLLTSKDLTEVANNAISLSHCSYLDGDENYVIPYYSEAKKFLFKFVENINYSILTLAEMSDLRSVSEEFCVEFHMKKYNSRLHEIMESDLSIRDMGIIIISFDVTSKWFRKKTLKKIRETDPNIRHHRNSPHKLLYDILRQMELIYN